MSHQLPIIVPYIAPSLLGELLAQPYLPQMPSSKGIQAAVLFADISGFTPLTEKLGEMSREGPDELSRLLNRYFAVMIALVEAQGGDIVKFGGDAMTVLFPTATSPPGHAVRRAYQAAQAMQTAMSQFTNLATSLGPVSLTMKVAVGVGEVQAMQVGGVLNRWEYLVMGQPLAQVYQADKEAESGEIVLSPEAAALIHPQPLPPQPLIRPDWEAMPEAEKGQLSNILRRYIPGSVKAWLDSSLHQWLGDMRSMSVLFVSLTELDYGLPDSVFRLHSFIQYAQQIIYRYQGTLNRLAYTGDRTGLLILFGAPPFAHEDDALRAVRCSLDLASFAEVNAAAGMALSLSMGVATGPLFAGPVGGPTRREYTVMGDAVNLAARLMSLASAEAQPILCDYETYRQTQSRLSYEALPPRRVKGKAGLLPIYRPSYAGVTLPKRPMRRTSTRMVGRAAELAQLTNLLDELEAGRGHMVLISGEAGIGKSRLVAALLDKLQARGLSALLGAGQSVARQTSYRAWRDVLAGYFDLDMSADLQSRQAQVQRLVTEIAPEQVQRLPLLNDVLLLGLPDNALTSILDPLLRQQSLIQLIIALLKAWIQERPLILILEDAHWLDSLSWELAVHMARALSDSQTPFLFVLNSRPLAEGEPGQQYMKALQALKGTQTIQLALLSQAAISELVTAQLQLPADSLPPVLNDFIQQQAGGNPFFAEEMVLMLQARGLITVQTVGAKTECVVSEGFATISQSLPDTLQGLVLARIDRLPPQQQLILKTAAVIGRSFAYTPLQYVLSHHLALVDKGLQRHLDSLAQLDLTPLEALEPELTYVFKHIIIQEVAYQTLLFQQRRTLHQTVAEWYEQQARAVGEGQASKTNPYWPLLVYHYRHAELAAKEAHFAQLAGEQAAAHYANAEAIDYFNRALSLLKTLPNTPERDSQELTLQLALLAPLMQTKGFVAPETEQTFNRASLLAEQLGDTSRNFPLLQGKTFFLSMQQAKHQDGRLVAEQFLSLAKQQSDSGMLLIGYRLMGIYLLLSGQIQSGRIHFEQGLALYNPSDHDVLTFSYGHNPGTAIQMWLGWPFWLLGYPDQASAMVNQAIAHGHQLNHANTIGMVLTFGGGCLNQMLGNVAAVEDHMKVAIDLNQKHGLALWLATATILDGWVWLKRGEPAAGVSRILAGWSAWQAAGAKSYSTLYWTLLVEGYIALGQIEKGLAAIGEALVFVAESEERLWEAELYRLKGELLWMQTSEAEAETTFQQAIAIARQQAAKSWELRATVSLARLWQLQGKTEEARQMLAEIYNWFTEGFDTVDLQEAKTLLEALL